MSTRAIVGDPVLENYLHTTRTYGVCGRTRPKTGRERPAPVAKRIFPAAVAALAAEGQQALATSNRRIARVYPYGFVARAFRWPAPAERLRVERDGTVKVETYDQKRPHGIGPRVTLSYR